MIEFNDDARHVVGANAVTHMQVEWTVVLEHHFSHCGQTPKLAILNCAVHSLLLRHLVRLLFVHVSRLGHPLASRAILFGDLKFFLLSRTNAQLNVLQLYFAFVHKITRLLRGHAVPDTVTCADDELRVEGDRCFRHIWVPAHCHLFWKQTSIFVLPIA